jgi:hypothetical protein
MLPANAHPLLEIALLRLLSSSVQNAVAGSDTSLVRGAVGATTLLV